MSDPRPWTWAAVFGGLWGALEMTAGTALKLARIPLAGALMAALALVILVTLRRLQPRAGVCLMAGAAAVFLKVLALGGVFPGPLVAMGVEAALVEGVFLVVGTRAVAAALAGAAVLAWGPLQMVGMVWLVAGPRVLASWGEALEGLAGRVGAGGVSPGVLLSLVAGLHAAAGVAAGLGAWRMAGRVGRRLRGASP